MTNVKPSDIFNEHGFVIIHDIFTLEEIEIFTNYALMQEKRQGINGDIQSPGAFSEYADPLMESLMIHLHPIIEQCTDLELYPTYSYYRVYRNGHKLSKHKDRKSCEISVSLALGYSYDSNTYRWPLFVNENEIFLKPGDIAIYKGVELSHWREPFNIQEDAYHCQAFLHYVNANGKYKDYMFDGRESIGDLERINKDLDYNFQPDTVKYITDSMMLG